MSKEGLYKNIWDKRKRIEKGSGEKMRKPGEKGAPTAKAFKLAAKTAKKKMEMGGQMSSASLPTMLASKGLGSPLLSSKKKKVKKINNGKTNKRKSK